MSQESKNLLPDSLDKVDKALSGAALKSLARLDDTIIRLFAIFLDSLVYKAAMEQVVNDNASVFLYKKGIVDGISRVKDELHIEMEQREKAKKENEDESIR